MAQRSVWWGVLAGIVFGIAVARLGTGGSSAPEAAPTDAPACAAAEATLSDREIIDRCYLVWAGDRNALFANTYLGISAIQNPFDAWIIHELIHERRPDVIVDVGTYHGGSAALWATYLAQVNPEGRVISIDIEDQVRGAEDLEIVQERVDFLIGSSTDPAIVAEVGRRIAGREALFILDSLHTREHVYQELVAYSPFVRQGGYIVVQDTPIDRYSDESLRAEGYDDAMIESFRAWESARPVDPDFGIRQLRGKGAGAGVAAFLETTDDFEIEKSRERLLLTNSWNGYLKRVR